MPPALHVYASREKVKTVDFWDVLTLWLHPLDVKLEERLLFQALKLKDAVQFKTVHGHRLLALTKKRAGLEEVDAMKSGA